MFSSIPSQWFVIGSTIMAIIMGTAVLAIRLRAQKQPATVKKIIIPPIMMSTGALMFVFEPFRLELMQVVEAAVVGAVLSIFLIATSKFEVVGQHIYLKASKAFPFILIGLLVLRIVLKIIFSHTLPIAQLGGMFWVLAFAMLWPWRIAMLMQFKKLQQAQ